MITREFRFYLSGVTDDQLVWSDRLLDAGCDDSGMYMTDRVVHVDFHRQAESLNQANASALKAGQSCGYTMDRIELDTKEAARWTA